VKTVQARELGRSRERPIQLADSTDCERGLQRRAGEGVQKPLICVHVSLLGVHCIGQSEERLVGRVFAQVDEQAFEWVFSIRNGTQCKVALGQIDLPSVSL
jgi:hypothetical protein